MQDHFFMYKWQQTYTLILFLYLLISFFYCCISIRNLFCFQFKNLEKLIFFSILFFFFTLLDKNKHI